MPNIEIHGMKASETQDFVARIWGLLSGAPYRNIVVVTTAGDVVRDINGTAQPFLRIVATTTAGADIFEDIEKRLASLNMDTEELLLRGFKPKKK